MDPDWLTENDGNNKDWIECLVRDFNSPVEGGNEEGQDPYFPFSRMFDW